MSNPSQSLSDPSPSPPPQARRDGKLLGPGRVVMVVGPSGAGKDTLMDGARAQLSSDGRFVFPRRLITREADPISEDHDTISQQAFDTLVGEDRVGLCWQAHGKGYVIPQSIRTDVAEGRVVVFNGSRAAVDDAKTRYAHVNVILIRVDTGVLEQRLVARNRESAADIARRLQRASMAADPSWTVIDNDGSVAQGVDRLVAAIKASCEAG